MRFAQHEVFISDHEVLFAPYTSFISYPRAAIASVTSYFAEKSAPIFLKMSTLKTVFL